MKKILVLLGVAALATAGCKSTDRNGSPSDQNPAYAPSATPPLASRPYPPSPNTMNNPPAAVTAPAPPPPQ